MYYIVTLPGSPNVKGEMLVKLSPEGKQTGELKVSGTIINGTKININLSTEDLGENKLQIYEGKEEERLISLANMELRIARKYYDESLIYQISNQPPPGGNIPPPLGTSTSTSTSLPNSKGEFSIGISDSSNSNTKKLRITAKGYIPKEIPISKGDGSIKDNLGNISLTPEKKQLEVEKAKLSQPTKKELENSIPERKELSYFAQKKLIKTKREVINTLLPLVVTMLKEFGINELEKLLKQNVTELSDRLIRNKECPPRQNIIKIINKKNKITSQLNLTLNVIKSTEILLTANNMFLIGAQGVLTVAENIPPPYNPTPPGSLKRLQQTISFIQAINTSINSLLKSLKKIINKVIRLLSMLDQLISECSEGVIDNKTISKELNDLTSKQSFGGSPIVRVYNGFILDVVDVESPTDIKRRRAIAKNSQGVIMLKGEPSYSSIKQILIDELIFYIEQNNLKAD